MNSTKHKNLIKNQRDSNINVLQNFVQPSKSFKNDSVKEAEIKLSCFFAEHNIPFRAMDHLSPLLAQVFPDSNIAKDISIKRTKTKNIITNVIAESHKSALTKTLTTTKFSILVDESTDISVTKTACIVVRYFDVEVGRVVTNLWEYVPTYVEGKDVATQGTAAHLYTVILNSFIKKHIPLYNIIGFASDGCNMMMGEHNSVASRFKDSCPGIVIFKCICHSLHICSSQACKNLPRSCEDLARNIYTFFKVRIICGNETYMCRFFFNFSQAVNDNLNLRNFSISLKLKYISSCILLRHVGCRWGK